jgi:hypothetical protein
MWPPGAWFSEVPVGSRSYALPGSESKMILGKGAGVNSGTVLQIPLLMMAVLAWPVAWAQKPREIELTRAAIQSDRHQIVQNAMSFTPSELEAFKPVYREYREKVEALGDRKVKLISRVMDGYSSLSDAQAKQLTDEWLKIQGEELALKRTYIERLRKVLPEKKVARFFQLENKLDAALLYNLAGTVPMIE